MNTNKNNGEIVIDIGQLIHALWRHVLIIIVAAEICALAAFLGTYFFISPKYSATAKMYVNNSSFVFGNVNYSISNSEITASTNLVNTYTEILNSRITLEEVIEVAKLPYTYSQLSGMIKTNIVEDTAVFSVTVTCGNPTDAELIANTIAKVLPNRIADVIDGASVRIVDYAIVPSSRSAPSYTKNTLIGAIIGFILSAGAIVVLEIVATQNDVEIHSAAELSELYPNIPILASVPDMRRAGNKNGYYSKYYAYKDDKNGKDKE